MKISQKLKKILKIGTIALATLVPVSAKAQSVFTGLRGPTEFQVDNRTSYSIKESQTGVESETLANNLILKYWNGTNNGVFAFANFPYKYIKSDDNTSRGMGDLSLGIGPRFERKIWENKLGFLTYIGTVLPTGNKDSIPALGSGRVDYKTGFFGTILSSSKRYEADFSLDYTLTEGDEISDDASGGLVLGGRINDNIRVVVGPTFNYKSGGNNDGDNALNGRINLRYTPSDSLGKRIHFELWYDKSIKSHGKSSVKNSDALTLIGRLNF